MKQTITPEQLSQLTDKGKERLINYWSTRADDLYERGLLPQYFSIGNMIEFLSSQSSSPDINISKGHTFTLNSGSVYTIDKLCDKLWSACVEVLNRE